MAPAVGLGELFSAGAGYSAPRFLPGSHATVTGTGRAAIARHCAAHARYSSTLPENTRIPLARLESPRRIRAASKPVYTGTVSKVNAPGRRACTSRAVQFWTLRERPRRAPPPGAVFRREARGPRPIEQEQHVGSGVVSPDCANREEDRRAWLELAEKWRPLARADQWQQSCPSARPATGSQSGAQGFRVRAWFGARNWQIAWQSWTRRGKSRRAARR